ncbi:swr1 complex component [Lignoscripta atroalba]|nr:swr1 complex component [Lignoscripta atroalba]
MQNEHHINNQNGLSGEDIDSTPAGDSQASALDTRPHQDTLQTENNDCEDHDDGPPAKKRKLVDAGTRQRSASRPISPPWRKVTVEGPTSFVEGGRRKSSRTNAVPLDLQPPADKRQTRATIQKSHVTKSKYGSASVTKSSPLTPAATQPQTNGKRPHSAGKGITNVASKSPAKPQLPNGVSSKHLAAPETPIKPRSHKKKFPPIPPKSPISPVESSSPHRTRRSARASKVTTTEVETQTKGTNGWHVSEEDRNEREGEDGDEDEDEEEEEEEVKVDPNFRPQRLKFKVHMPTVTIQHPGHVLPKRHFPTFRDWLEQDDPLVGDDNAHLTDEEAVEEAQVRQRIIQAAEPGGLLSREKCSVYVPDPQEEPPQQYAHQSHLAAHAVYFRKLMNKEHRDHLNAAKRLAYAAAAAWKNWQPKTLEEVKREEEQEREDAVKAVHKQLFRDLLQKWEMARAEVNRRRMEKWEEEQEALGKQALNRVLEQSTQLLDKRRRRGSSSAVSEEEEDDEAGSDTDTDGESGEVGPGSASDDEKNVSSSGSESVEDIHDNALDDDEGLTVEELRQKYAELPSENLDRPPDLDHEQGSIAYSGDLHTTVIPNASSLAVGSNARQNLTRSPSHSNDQGSGAVVLDEVDDALIDDSDESTDMDDESEESEDGGSNIDSDDSSGEEASDAEGGGLLGFFPKKELEMTEDPAEVSIVDVTNGDDEFDEEIEEVSLIPDATQVQTPSASNSEEPSMDVHQSLKLITTGHPSSPLRTITEVGQTQVVPSGYSPDKPSPLAHLTNIGSPMEVQRPSLPTTPVSSQALKTPVPPLLRGTLREYQHYGLDWLAGLYANGTNGILADEMGLGKTIQTIALLAHLAVEHEVWGPHLIIVPTSVMLNWEMEFKKFLPGFKILTYYGTQEERKQKRKGWLDDDKWHVCITSYHLVLQDQQTFKRRAWHYLVLDEAHNIKNFRSQRWQALLTFRTRARLLLTGTPLQNNLTELWSLMFFLMPSDSTDTGIAGFADLQAFTSWFKKPVNQILEHGRDTMDDEAKELVRRLHGVLRPYLLRRLKADVEKQMPGKYEHVVYCKLSKRQRYLYDGFMSRAHTRETLASGNYLSIINCLMQLRKVCNHPDLFETRQIVTSFAMPRSAVADFEIKELLVRRRLLQDDPLRKVNLDVVNLLPGANGPVSALDTIQNCRLGALGRLRHLVTQQYGRILPNMRYDATSVDTALACMENTARTARLEGLRHHAYLTSLRSQRRSLYSHSLMERLRVDLKQLPSPPIPKRRKQLVDWLSNVSPAMEDMVLTLPRRSEALQTTIQKFACVTPAVVASDINALTLTRPGIKVIRDAQEVCTVDSFHEARMRLSIAFPDKRLLQYDCGKLQRLDTLLRTLQAGGHRALIFTQMTKVLDILEQFLNIHGHRYLRLDGATKVEQRQILTDRFNNDDRILVFILSSRSGGLGINLTGADTVIFYDLDWNPAMDKQCQDRCHRIGQTRDVHIYRFVSEYTIEANILRKANQKRMLDDVVIQEGDFTTDYFNKLDVKDVLGEEALHDGDAQASAAMDRVLGADSGHGTLSGKIFEQAEDKEDIAAAKVAEKEMVHVDDVDFEERTNSGGNATPKTPGPPTPRDLMPPPSASMYTPSGLQTPRFLEATAESGFNASPDIGADELSDEEDVVPSRVDDWIIAYVEWELKDIPVVPPVDKMKKKAKKGGEHRVRRPR